MKKLLIIAFILLNFIYIDLVLADSYKCPYKFNIEAASCGGTKEMEGYFEIDTDTNEIIPEDDIVQIFSDYNVKIFDEVLDPNYNTATFIKELNGGCPNLVYACEGKIMLPNGQIYIFFLFNGTLMNKIQYDKTYDYGSGYDKIKIQTGGCSTGVLQEDETDAPSVDTEFDCTTFGDLWRLVEDKWCDSSKQDCDVNQIQEYKKNKQKIKEFCNKKLSYGTSVELDDCMKECVHLSEKINKLEVSNSSNGECGFSERLIVFVGNIVKWGKYIVPVVAIVLGILDFIKAIGTDKDDEMKKAQGKFVKRLIAAALIFIVPFIIEFILDMMEFDRYIDGCGIIDL